MKRILVLSNECFRSESANGYCLENIIRCLVDREDVFVDVFSYYDTDLFDEYTNYEVNYVKSSLTVPKLIKRIINAIVYRIFSPDILTLYSNRMIKAIEKRKDVRSYDIILSSSGGYGIQIVALKLHDKYGVPIVPMLLDPPIELNFLYRKNRPYYRHWLRVEEELFKNSRSILIEENLLVGMSKTKYVDKMKGIGLPLIVPRTTEKRWLFNDNRIHIAFFGTLWKDIRDPKYAISILVNSVDCVIDFYGNEQTQALLEEYKSDRVRYCGMVAHEEMSAIVHQYDFLLNISNSFSVQTPSKLIEYFSYLKPIINIVTDPMDKTRELVEQYGNGISLLKDGADNEELLLLFINQHQKESPFKEIEGKFITNTPRYTVDKIMELMM